MKIQITITREIIERSLMCGTDLFKGQVTSNCAFAAAFNELVPNVHVDYEYIHFLDIKKRVRLATILTTQEQYEFIKDFDGMFNFPEKRLELVGQKFIVEIPEVVLEYWFEDHVKLAQAIANAPSLEVIE